MMGNFVVKVKAKWCRKLAQSDFTRHGWSYREIWLQRGLALSDPGVLSEGF